MPRRPQSTKDQIAQDFQAYNRAWARQMTQIWSDRLIAAGAVDTGTLLRSIRNGLTRINEADAQMEFRFVRYGVYVDAGVGNGYRHNNGGDLEFLGKAYRIEHGKGKARERTEWYSRSWAISRRVLMTHLTAIAGDMAAATLAVLR